MAAGQHTCRDGRSHGCNSTGTENTGLANKTTAAHVRDVIHCTLFSAFDELFAHLRGNTCVLQTLTNHLGQVNDSTANCLAAHLGQSTARFKTEVVSRLFKTLANSLAIVS